MERHKSIFMPEPSQHAATPTDPILPTRLKAGSPGLGQASQTEVESRAEELAASDGRDAFTDADLAAAAIELGGGATTPVAPEANFALEQMTAWDDPPEQAGHRVERAPLEGEDNIGERLIEDGLAEADHAIRVSAADEETAKLP